MSRAHRFNQELLNDLQEIFRPGREVKDIMADLSRLIADVTNERTAVNSMIAFTGGLAAAMRATAGDQAKIDDLATELESQTAALTEAARQSAPTPHWITLTVLYVGVGAFWVWMVVTIADSIF